MKPTMHHLRTTLAAISFAFLVITTFMPLAAAPGDPVAVRCWPDGGVSVETHWGFIVAIDAAKDKVGAKPADAAVATGQQVNHVLTRLPNEKQPVWLSTDKFNRIDANAVSVRCVKQHGLSMVVVEADGVRIAKGTWGAADENKAEDAAGGLTVDVLLLTSNGAKELNSDALATAVKRLQPHTVILSNGVAGPSKDAVASFARKIGAGKAATQIAHNTVAVSQLKTRPKSVRLLTVGTSPWKMPAELAKEFEAMEKASRDSQKVFADLSVNQLNFKPSNGTHTPRWNAEHMMGRQLLFFSQIYNQQDPAIPVMDLNPKQMPKDYVFAHPTWTGVEEAQQMQRVSDFTRRFAYLLDGVELNQRAPGSRWPSLLALLRQMQRHYGEHTANTVKKFSLPDFPRK